MLGYKKGNKKLLTGQIPLHYPADRVYLDGDPTKSVQDKVARKADLTNLDLTGTTNTTGSTISSGTYFYLNGTLVRAKTAIASGATFTLNTNYEVVTVGDALDDLKTFDVSSSVTIDSTNVSEGAILAKYCKATNLLTLVTTTRIKSTNSVTSYGEVTIANIALPYRPTYAVRIPIYSATGGNDSISMLYVETNGDIKLVNIGSSSTSFYARFNTSFLLS